MRRRGEPSAASDLIRIPVLDVPTTEEPAVFSARAEPARLAQLIAQARRTYTPLGLHLADARSRQWSRHQTRPYADAVRAVDQAVGRPGAFLLNYSYEWGCTSGAVEDAALGGPSLLGTLDWPFDGLGRTVGWVASRLRVGRSTALSPTHLLRRTFDTCHSFAEAVTLIRHTPICLPAIFTLAGTAPGETVVIERTQAGWFESADAAAGNHWAAAPGTLGRPRNPSSRPRRAAMCRLLATGSDWSLDWLRDPILQPDTRVVVMANPKTGRVLVQGWETTGAATEVLALREDACIAIKQSPTIEAVWNAGQSAMLDEWNNPDEDAYND